MQRKVLVAQNKLNCSLILPRLCRISKVKIGSKKPAGLYYALPIPEKPWEMTYMDFIVNLPIDQNYTIVLTIVDCFSKICMLIPLSSTTA